MKNNSIRLFDETDIYNISNYVHGGLKSCSYDVNAVDMFEYVGDEFSDEFDALESLNYLNDFEKEIIRAVNDKKVITLFERLDDLVEDGLSNNEIMEDRNEIIEKITDIVADKMAKYIK